MAAVKSRPGGRTGVSPAEDGEGGDVSASFRALHDAEYGDTRRESSEAARVAAILASVRMSFRKTVCVGVVGWKASNGSRL